MFPKNQYSFPAGVDRKEEGSVWRVHGVQKKEGEGSRGPETAVQWTAIRYMLFSIRGFYIHISLVFDTAAHGKKLGQLANRYIYYFDLAGSHGLYLRLWPDLFSEVVEEEYVEETVEFFMKEEVEPFSKE